MPVTVSYPGVYIQEIPSGVTTITGVATSITAFVGVAQRGPQDTPTTIFSWADYERQFGGLDPSSAMSYAVQDFFQNGGSQAIIVRVYAPPAPAAGAPAGTPIPTGVAAFAAATSDPKVTLNLVASSPGVWGNSLAVKIDTNGITDDVAKQFGTTKNKLFNLTVVLNPPGPAVEVWKNLSIDDNAQRVDRVLTQSQYISVADGTMSTLTALPTNTLPAADPTVLTNVIGAAGIVLFAGGDDGATPSFIGDPADQTGIYALETADLFNILCIPPPTLTGDTDPVLVYQPALSYCVKRRAMLIVDPPAEWKRASNVTDAITTDESILGLTGLRARNAAIYFPRLNKPDPLLGGMQGTFVPCGAIAGLWAASDTASGVWTAPAGLNAAVTGINGLATKLTDEEQGLLNPIGVNCLRTFPLAGSVVWGARTVRGADQLADDYKYIPVRRLALYIEESLFRGTKWVVFQPNGPVLWGEVRLSLTAFMQNLFRQGAFQGTTPKQAYFVKCDAENNPPSLIALGYLNITVGFAPLYPAEFVVISLQQIAGQTGP